METIHSCDIINEWRKHRSDQSISEEDLYALSNVTTHYAYFQHLATIFSVGKSKEIELIPEKKKECTYERRTYLKKEELSVDIVDQLKREYTNCVLLIMNKTWTYVLEMKEGKKNLQNEKHSNKLKDLQTILLMKQIKEIFEEREKYEIWKFMFLRIILNILLYLNIKIHYEMQCGNTYCIGNMSTNSLSLENPMTRLCIFWNQYCYLLMKTSSETENNDEALLVFFFLMIQKMMVNHRKNPFFSLATKEYVSEYTALNKREHEKGKKTKSDVQRILKIRGNENSSSIFRMPYSMQNEKTNVGCFKRKTKHMVKWNYRKNQRKMILHKTEVKLNKRYDRRSTKKRNHNLVNGYFYDYCLDVCTQMHEMMLIKYKKINEEKYTNKDSEKVRVKHHKNHYRDRWTRIKGNSIRWTQNTTPTSIQLITCVSKDITEVSSEKKESKGNENKRKSRKKKLDEQGDEKRKDKKKEYEKRKDGDDNSSSDDDNEDDDSDEESEEESEEDSEEDDEEEDEEEEEEYDDDDEEEEEYDEEEEEEEAEEEEDDKEEDEEDDYEEEDYGEEEEEEDYEEEDEEEDDNNEIAEDDEEDEEEEEEEEEDEEEYEEDEEEEESEEDIEDKEETDLKEKEEESDEEDESEEEDEEEDDEEEEEDDEDDTEVDNNKDKHVGTNEEDDDQNEEDILEESEIVSCAESKSILKDSVSPSICDSKSVSHSSSESNSSESGSRSRSESKYNTKSEYDMDSEVDEGSSSFDSSSSNNSSFIESTTDDTLENTKYDTNKSQYFGKRKKAFKHNYVYLKNLFKENICINTSNVSNFIAVSKDKLTATYTAWGKHTDIACVQVNRCANRDCNIYYFEVEVLNCSNYSKIVVGMTSKNYTINKNPGSEFNSFGYKSDDGKKIIDGKVENYSYGYMKNDIIGCGINYYDNSVFFTKNGKLLGKACSFNAKYDYYPTVGLSALGDKIKFHLNNFCFDIYNLIFEENEKERKVIKSIDVNRSIFFDVIKAHLIKCGYRNTYKSFVNYLENNQMDEEENSIFASAAKQIATKENEKTESEKPKKETEAKKDKEDKSSSDEDHDGKKEEPSKRKGKGGKEETCQSKESHSITTQELQTTSSDKAVTNIRKDAEEYAKFICEQIKKGMKKEENKPDKIKDDQKEGTNKKEETKKEKKEETIEKNESKHEEKEEKEKKEESKNQEDTKNVQIANTTENKKNEKENKDNEKKKEEDKEKKEERINDKRKDDENKKEKETAGSINKNEDVSFYNYSSLSMYSPLWGSSRRNSLSTIINLRRSADTTLLLSRLKCRKGLYDNEEGSSEIGNLGNASKEEEPKKNTEDNKSENGKSKDNFQMLKSEKDQLKKDGKWHPLANDYHTKYFMNLYLSDLAMDKLINSLETRYLIRKNVMEGNIINALQLIEEYYNTLVKKEEGMFYMAMLYTQQLIEILKPHKNFVKELCEQRRRKKKEEQKRNERREDSISDSSYKTYNTLSDNHYYDDICTDYDSSTSFFCDPDLSSSFDEMRNREKKLIGKKRKRNKNEKEENINGTNKEPNKSSEGKKKEVGVKGEEFLERDLEAEGKSDEKMKQGKEYKRRELLERRQKEKRNREFDNLHNELGLDLKNGFVNAFDSLNNHFIGNTNENFNENTNEGKNTKKEGTSYNDYLKERKNELMMYRNVHANYNNEFIKKSNLQEEYEKHYSLLKEEHKFFNEDNPYAQANYGCIHETENDNIKVDLCINGLKKKKEINFCDYDSNDSEFKEHYYDYKHIDYEQIYKYLYKNSSIDPDQLEKMCSKGRLCLALAWIKEKFVIFSECTKSNVQQCIMDSTSLMAYQKPYKEKRVRMFFSQNRNLLTFNAVNEGILNICLNVPVYSPLEIMVKHLILCRNLLREKKGNIGIKYDCCYLCQPYKKYMIKIKNRKKQRRYFRDASKVKNEKSKINGKTNDSKRISIFQ